MANAMDLDGQTCSICFDSDDFRVLECGHLFCIACLGTLHANYDGKIQCPMDRKVDETPLASLPTPHQFQGTLFIHTIDDERYININQLLDAQVSHRMQTIRHLRRVASSLNVKELKCAGAKIGGSVIAVIGSVMGVVGLGLSLTGVGAAVGAPLGIAGMGIAAAGGLTTGLTMVVEGILKKIGIDEIQDDLRKDNFRAEQIKVLLTRASTDQKISQKWSIEGIDIAYIGGMIPRLAKFGLTTAAGLRVALGIGRAATTTGLHVAGLVFAAALIPLDIAQMVISSIRIHKDEPSQVIKDIAGIADNLDKELKLFLIEGNYFHLIYTNDVHWVYIALFATNLSEFKNGLPNGFNLAQLSEMGHFVEAGQGHQVPKHVTKKMQDEWYLHYDEYLARMLEEELNLSET